MQGVRRTLSSAIPSYLLNVPQVEVTTLPNGVRVASQVQFYCRSCQQGGYGQTSSFGVFIDTGSRYETKEKNGVAHYVEHLTFKGTNRRSRIDIEKEIENIGAHLNAFLFIIVFTNRYTSREQTVYYSSCFNKDIGQVMDLLGDILLHSKYLFAFAFHTDLIQLQLMQKDGQSFSKLKMSSRTNMKLYLIFFMKLLMTAVVWHTLFLDPRRIYRGIYSFYVMNQN